MGNLFLVGGEPTLADCSVLGSRVGVVRCLGWGLFGDWLISIF